jgi:hypothetical protein
VIGYIHPGYAESLAEFGTPRELPQCGGWVLERQIPDFPDHDAMGCYPLFCCQDWSRLHVDLENVGSELVSLGVVADPWGNFDVTYLEKCFNDKVIPFKQHYVVELDQSLDSFVSSHHRRYAKKSLREIQVEKVQQPIQFLDEWGNLYDTLIKRHTITGIAAFSRSAFAKQLAVPGLVMFRALHNETTVGAVLWYIQEDVGYYHLGAYSDVGYKLRASFGLFWTLMEYFAGQGLRWLNLGAGAGISGDGSDGLSRFKRGWSTGTRTAYFCGHIFDRQKYAELVKAKGIIATDYFPAYRRGEFQ